MVGAESVGVVLGVELQDCLEVAEEEAAPVGGLFFAVVEFVEVCDVLVEGVGAVEGQGQGEGKDEQQDPHIF